jgi:hypothetical protein
MHAVSLRSETRVCACSGLVRLYDTSLASLCYCPFIALRLPGTRTATLTLNTPYCLLNEIHRCYIFRAKTL